MQETFKGSFTSFAKAYQQELNKFFLNIFKKANSNLVNPKPHFKHGKLPLTCLEMRVCCFSFINGSIRAPIQGYSAPIRQEERISFKCSNQRLRSKSIFIRNIFL